MNKKYWNQLNLLGKLSDEFVKHHIRHSYNEVVKSTIDYCLSHWNIFVSLVKISYLSQFRKNLKEYIYL